MIWGGFIFLYVLTHYYLPYWILISPFSLLKGNDDIALVQTRWAFVNKDENLLTRLQNINLSFHFEVEQQVNGIFINFFGFNGTAGVWRIKALEECGGWLERTTVEDMDIAVRAHLCGWKFVYLNDVKVCDLSSFVEFYFLSWNWILKWLICSFCSPFVSFRNPMRHTKNSNTAGIQVQCSCSGCALLIYSVQRYGTVCKLFVCLQHRWNS